MEWTWSLPLIAFLISFSNIFRRIMGWNVLEVSYNDLLGFGIIIDIDFLK